MFCSTADTSITAYHDKEIRGVGPPIYFPQQSHPHTSLLLGCKLTMGMYGFMDRNAWIRNDERIGFSLYHHITIIMMLMTETTMISKVGACIEDWFAFVPYFSTLWKKYVCGLCTYFSTFWLPSVLSGKLRTAENLQRADNTYDHFLRCFVLISAVLICIDTKNSLIEPYTVIQL